MRLELTQGAVHLAPVGGGRRLGSPDDRGAFGEHALHAGRDAGADAEVLDVLQQRGIHLSEVVDALDDCDERDR